MDARRTETAKLATRHLALRPGTDYALLGFLIRELLRDGADLEYLAAHATHVDELRAAVERFDLATVCCDHRPRGGRAHRPARGGAPPRSPRATDGHRHLDGAGGQPHAVVRGRAPRRHGLARAAGRGVVQPRLRPGARQASGHPRRRAGAGPSEPPGAAAPGRRVPVDHDGRRDGGRQPAGVLRARRQRPLRAPGYPACAGGARAHSRRRRLGHPARGYDRGRDARARGGWASRARRSAALLGLPRAHARGPVHARGRSRRRRSEARLVAARRARRATRRTDPARRPLARRRPPTTISSACASGPPPERRSTSSRQLRPPSSTTIARSAGWSATSSPTGAGTSRPSRCSPSSRRWRTLRRSC